MDIDMDIDGCFYEFAAFKGCSKGEMGPCNIRALLNFVESILCLNVVQEISHGPLVCREFMSALLWVDKDSGLRAETRTP